MGDKLVHTCFYSHINWLIDLETNLMDLEAKLQMTSRESRTLIGWGNALTNGSSGFEWHHLEFSFQVWAIGFQVIEFAIAVMIVWDSCFAAKKAKKQLIWLRGT